MTSLDLTDSNTIGKIALVEMYFDSFEFRRSQHIDVDNVTVDFEYSLNKVIDGDTKLFESSRFVLVCIIKSPDGSFYLNVSQNAYFKCTNEEDVMDNYVSNALAIMFPFLRSQVSIITSQPGMIPIILPILNINNIVKKVGS